MVKDKAVENMDNEYEHSVPVTNMILETAISKKACLDEERNPESRRWDSWGKTRQNRGFIRILPTEQRHASEAKDSVYQFCLNVILATPAPATSNASKVTLPWIGCYKLSCSRPLLTDGRRKRCSRSNHLSHLLRKDRD